MRNPLRSEAEMFRLLIGAIVYFVAVVIASVAGGVWWGVGVAVVLLVPAALWFLGKIGEPLSAPAAAVQPLERAGKLLVLVPPADGVDGLGDELARRADVREVVVVVPAVASPVEQVTGAVDDRRAEAEEQAKAVARALSGRGVQARGEVGADEPIQALEDALRLFGADEIVLVGGDDDTVARARERFAVPVTRVP